MNGRFVHEVLWLHEGGLIDDSEGLEGGRAGRLGDEALVQGSTERGLGCCWRLLMWLHGCLLLLNSYDDSL